MRFHSGHFSFGVARLYALIWYLTRADHNLVRTNSLFYNGSSSTAKDNKLTVAPERQTRRRKKLKFMQNLPFGKETTLDHDNISFVRAKPSDRAKAQCRNCSLPTFFMLGDDPRNFLMLMASLLCYC